MSLHHRTAQWRAALEAVEALQPLDDAARAGRLARWAAEAPDVHALMRALLEGGGTASTEGELAALRPFDAAPAADLQGREVGPYRLVREIGAGGMGQVWLAERTDGRFEGVVAVKLLAASLHGPSIERFRREGRVLGLLTHPNIARLLDAGVMPSGQLYLVLEHVDGLRLDRYCDDQALSVERRIRLFLEVCAAVAHAHGHLVVHRDLKPSNILVDREGHAKLLDFGIAKLLDSASDSAAETELTLLGGRAMTPEYAAPEQVAGAPVTTATDVYALGVLLYELLSGHRPYGDRTAPAELLRAIAETDPQRPSTRPVTAEIAARRASTPPRLRRRLRGDLDLIVAKALKKKPQERYASVEALADDLRRVLADQPVSVRADSVGYQLRKFAQRHRAGVAAGGFAALALLAGSGVALWQAAQARQQRDSAEAVRTFLEELFESNSDARDGAGAAGLSARQLLDRGAERLRAGATAGTPAHAELLYTLANLYAELGESERALGLYQDSIASMRNLRGPRDREIARRLGDLAGTLIEMGRPDQALQANTQAGQIYDALGEERTYARAIWAINDAALHVGRDVSRARRSAERAVAILEQLPPHELYGRQQLRSALSYLGHALAREGDFAEAQASFQRAADVAAAEKNGENTGHGYALATLGEITLQRGDPRRAVEQLTRSQRLLRDHAPQDPAAHALAESRLGEALLAAGDDQAGFDLLQRSLAAFQKAHGEASRNVAIVRLRLMRAYLMRGDADAARREVELALPALAGASSRHYLAAAHASRARIHLQQGDAEAARRDAQAALAACEALGSVVGLAALDAAFVLAELEPTPERALAHAREAVGRHQPKGLLASPATLELLWLEAAAAAARGDAAAASRAGAALQEASRRFPDVPAGRAWLAKADAAVATAR